MVNKTERTEGCREMNIYRWENVLDKTCNKVAFWKDMVVILAETLDGWDHGETSEFTLEQEKILWWREKGTPTHLQNHPSRVYPAFRLCRD